MLSGKLKLFDNCVSFPIMYLWLYIFMARQFLEMAITCTDESIVSIWDLSVVILQGLIT